MAVSESPSGKSTPGSHQSRTLSSVDKSAQSRTGRPPTTSILRSAMYYQNRIIIPEVKSRPATSASNRNSGGAVSSTTGVAINGPNIKGTPVNSNNSNFRASTAHMDGTRAGATSQTRLSHHERLRDTMDSRVDIVVTDTDAVNRPHKVKKKSIWRRIYRVLQDNRMKGDPNAELILAGSNPQDFRLLKKVLNISFLTIGIALLVSVVIVIIYSAIDPDETAPAEAVLSGPSLFTAS